MSREPKFKAWDKERKKIFDVISIDFEKREVCIKGHGIITWRSFDDCDLLEYTGLKDKNGKEIYEGDIVRAGSYKGIVKWSNNYLDYRIYTIPEHCYFRLGEQNYNDIEVIGNIHQNPELLEASEDAE